MEDELRDADNSLNTKNQDLDEAYRQIKKLEKWWKQATQSKKEMREKFEAHVKSL